MMTFSDYLEEAIRGLFPFNELSSQTIAPRSSRTEALHAALEACYREWARPSLLGTSCVIIPRVIRCPLFVVAWSLVPSLAHAHSGSGIRIAQLTNPIGVGEVAEDHYDFHWIDYDFPVATGTVTIDFFFTDVDPPTFNPTVIPDALEGELITSGILELDTANAYRWDTLSVPTGTYWIWSRLNEPPAENLPTLVSFSPGVLTVVHASDPVPPAVFVVPPQDPFLWPPTESIDIQYAAFDPDGSGRVRLEVTRAEDGSGLEIIADDLPADRDGRFRWSTAGYENGAWTVRATIRDARGYSFAAYGRYFVTVNNPAPAMEPNPPMMGVCTCALASAGSPLSCGRFWCWLVLLRCASGLRATCRAPCCGERRARR